MDLGWWYVWAYPADKIFSGLPYYESGCSGLRWWDLWGHLYPIHRLLLPIDDPFIPSPKTSPILPNPKRSSRSVAAEVRWTLPIICSVLILFAAIMGFCVPIVNLTSGFQFLFRLNCEFHPSGFVLPDSCDYYGLSKYFANGIVFVARTNSWSPTLSLWSLPNENWSNGICWGVVSSAAHLGRSWTGSGTLQQCSAKQPSREQDEQGLFDLTPVRRAPVFGI